MGTYAESVNFLQKAIFGQCESLPGDEKAGFLRQAQWTIDFVSSYSRVKKFHYSKTIGKELSFDLYSSKNTYS